MSGGGGELSKGWHGVGNRMHLVRWVESIEDKDNREEKGKEEKEEIFGRKDGGRLSTS